MTTDDVREKAYELITHAIWCSISGTSANAHADDVLAALESAGLMITAADAPDPERVLIGRQDAEHIAMVIRDAQIRNKVGAMRVSKSIRDKRQPALDAAFEAIQAALAPASDRSDG